MGETSSSTFVLICLCVRNSLTLLYFFLSVWVFTFPSYMLSFSDCFPSFNLSFCFNFNIFLLTLFTFSIFLFTLFTFSIFLFRPIFFSSTCRCIVLWSIENHKLNPVAVKLFSLMCPFSISYQTFARQKRQKKRSFLECHSHCIWCNELFLMKLWYH